jgi:phenylalanyl-tRNA synthetase beta chain
MRLPLSFLRPFLKLKHSANVVSDALTLLGLEVDGILNEKPSFQHIVCGEILSVKPHPESQKLLLLEVTDGKKKYPIVCGDTQCKTGEKAAFAPHGALILSEGSWKTIAKTTVRGAPSEGMLCSAKDLGLSEDNDRVYILDSSTANGQDLTDLLWDPILEISLTPNLGHCQSALGIARELAAFWSLPITLPQFALKEGNDAPKVSIKNPEYCLKYTCRKIENVKVGPSPLWLKRKMEALGENSINNVVDATNLVMHEYGLPLHAFDLAKIKGQIHVKTMSEETPFTFLDGKERTYPKGSLFICDDEKPLALAGVMGGLDSAVSDETKDLLVESAYFDPLKIRKTSREMALRTESSQRFEKGIDPNALLLSLDAVCDLIVKLAGGKVSKVGDAGKKEFPMRKIPCRLDRVEKMLGRKFSLSELENIFHRLGCKTESSSIELLVSLPTYRNDLSLEIDLIEEIARIYGYNNFEKRDSYFTTSSVPHHPLFLFEREIRQRLAAQGLTEILTSDLISPALASLLSDKESQVEVVHSKSEEHKVLRSALLPGLLQVVRHNLAHKNSEIRGFEIGRIHFKRAAKFEEETMGAVILTGSDAPHWEKTDGQLDFFHIKGIIENLTKSQHLSSKVQFTTSSHPSFHPFRQASFSIGDTVLGVIGEIHPDLLEKMDIKQRVLYSEFNLSLLRAFIPADPKMKPLPIYPGSERDWTITLDEHAPIGEVLKKIQSYPSPLLQKIELIGLYKSEKLGAHKKNATFRFFYRSPEKTLSYEEVEKEHARISEEVRAFLPA